MTASSSRGRAESPTPTPFSLTLARSLEAARIARHALHAWLVAWRCPGALVDDVTLVVSELVTNAIVHAESPPRVTADVRDGQLRLEVHDHSAVPPRRRDAGKDTGGYGLHFVATLADDWGWAPTASGKYVWTHHRVPIAPGRSSS